jgi:hypothetical protein
MTAPSWATARRGFRRRRGAADDTDHARFQPLRPRSRAHAARLKMESEIGSLVVFAVSSCARSRNHGFKDQSCQHRCCEHLWTTGVAADEIHDHRQQSEQDEADDEPNDVQRQTARHVGRSVDLEQSHQSTRRSLPRSRRKARTHRAGDAPPGRTRRSQGAHTRSRPSSDAVNAVRSIRLSPLHTRLIRPLAELHVFVPGTGGPRRPRGHACRPDGTTGRAQRGPSPRDVAG